MESNLNRLKVLIKTAVNHWLKPQKRITKQTKRCGKRFWTLSMGSTLSKAIVWEKPSSTRWLKLSNLSSDVFRTRLHTCVFGLYHWLTPNLLLYSWSTFFLFLGLFAVTEIAQLHQSRSVPSSHGSYSWLLPSEFLCVWTFWNAACILCVFTG